VIHHEECFEIDMAEESARRLQYALEAFAAGPEAGSPSSAHP
jgi:hypothetical protein